LTFCRELTAAGEHEREEAARLERSAAAAAARNTRLEEELSNLRAFIQKAVPGAAPVRVSRQELRPLSAREVEDLRASRPASTQSAR